MSLVRVERQDGVARLLLDSLANRNALSAQLRTELHQALRDAGGDDAVRSIVLGHTGTVFCSGADLTEARRGLPAPGTPTVPQILVEIWRSPKPVVAALSGVARAGGLGLVAACDVVVASSTITFACTEVRIGVVPAVISAEPDQLDSEVRRVTDAFALAAPGALAATKKLTRSEPAITELRTRLVELEELSARYFDSAEGREGLAAFAERRSPNWVR